MAATMGETVSGTLAATGNGDTFKPFSNKLFNTYVTGTWVGTATFQRSYDDGATWVTVPKPDLTDAAFTANINFEVEEARAGTLYRWAFTRSSGTLAYRFEQ